MPYTVNLPDGRAVEFPDSVSREEAAAIIRRQFGGGGGPQSGGLAALKAGMEGLSGAGSALMGKLGLKDLAQAEAEVAASKQRAADIFKPTEESWTQAPGTKFLELLGGSVPYMAAPLAAGAAALALPASVAAAPVLGGLATVGSLAGLGAAGLASAGQFTGTGLVRQMEGEEGSVAKKALAETSLPSAVAAAIPSALLDTLSMRMIPGIGRIFGQAGVKVTAENAKEIAEQGLKKTLADYAAKTGTTAGVEGATEAAQQVLERLQAGLSITNEKARDEYFESFLGGAILGGTLAPAGRFIERGGEQRQARGLLEKQAQEERKAAAEAEEAKKKTPEYALKLDADYQTAVAKMKELQAAVPKRPAKDALPEEQMAYKAAVDARNTHLKDVLKPLTDEYAPRKAEIAQLKERQRIEGMTPLDYQMEQAGVTFPAEEQRVFTGEEEIPSAAEPAPEAQYAQKQMALAQQQDLGTFETKDFVEYLMQDPAMAQRLVETQTPVPGVSKKESDALLGGLKLQLQAQAKQARTATEAQLQQEQADLFAQKPQKEKDPLTLWKESLEQAETQASEELERINFETIRPSGPPTVEVAPGITPIQNPDTLVKRLDALVAERDAAEVAADTAFAAGNREAGVEKAREREAAQAALNNLGQMEGAPRALMLLRKAQDTALVNTAQLLDDLKAGRTLGGPEAGTASSTPETLVNEVNRQRDSFITATVQEAAATRRLYGKSLTQEDAETATNKIRDVFNEWVTRTMAQPLTDVNWVDKMLATMQAERAVEGKDVSRAPWVQPLKQQYVKSQLTDALVKRLGRQRMEEISKGTVELKGAETTLPADTVRAVTSRAEADFSRLLQDAQKRAIAQASDPRPLEERRFGAYRAATQVLQEQLQNIASDLRQVPRSTFTREQPLLKTQFAESEAAKVAEARGETAETAEGSLRRKRDYVDSLISQAFTTRRVPGIAEVLLTRAQDFLQKPLESTTATGEKRVQYRGTNALLDAAENIAGRILRGQNVERGDLVALRDELRAESARPGQAEVAGEREGQRELFPAAERRALAPKTTGVNLVGEPSQAGAIGFIREKPAAFEAARAKEAAKFRRATAVSERSEQLTEAIRAALDRLDVAQREALDKRVKERSDSLQSAWQSAVKKAKEAVIATRIAAQRPKVAALKKEINDIRKGGIEGLNKDTVDRMLAALAALDALENNVSTVVEAAEFVPIAKANKWVAFERAALAEAQAARDALPTPKSEADVRQKQAALARAEQARVQSLKGEERAVEEARVRAAQGQVRSAEGKTLPGIRVQRQALTAEIAALEERLPRIRGKAKTAAAEARLASLKTQRAGAPERIVSETERAEVSAEKRAETSAAYAARTAEREALEQRSLDLGTQIAEQEAAQQRARTPAGKAKIQATITALNKDLTFARGQLEALEESKPRRKGPATVVSGAGLARQKPLRTGYRKTLEAASEGLRRERERDIEIPGVFEFGPQDKLFSRGATENPSTTADVRTELGKVFPDLGRVEIFDSVDALLAANPEYEGKIPSDARGFVDPDTNKAFLIAENIEQGQAMGVLLHEVGAHLGLKNMLGDAQYNALVKAVEAWEKRNDGSVESRVAKEARERVEAAGTKAGQVNDELLAYAVEGAANAGVSPTATKSPLGQWLARIAQAFRKALEKFGLPAKALDAQGLVDMAFGAAKMEMRGQAAPAKRAEAAPAGEILFSRNLPTASRVANSLIGKEKGWLTKLRENFLGMGGRTQFVDKLAPIEEALKKGGVSTQKALQAMFFLRMYDQRMHFTSQAITEGTPEVVAKARKDGGTEYLIETKPGASIKQVVDILKQKDVIKAAGSADAANKLFTLYLAAIRAERVGYETLNFGRPWAIAEIKRIDAELKSTQLSQETRTNLQKKRANLEKRLSTMPTEADFKAARAEIEADPVLKAEFDKARDIYNQYNRNLLEFSVQTGAISRDEAKRLLAQNDYVPYYRMRDGVAQLIIGGETPIRVGNLKDSPHLKELVGGDEAIFDFLDSSVHNTAMLLDMSMKNLATKNAMFELRDVGLATVAKMKPGSKVPQGAVTFKRDGDDYFAIVDTDTIGIDSELLVKGMAGIPTMFPSFVRVLGIPSRILRRAVVASPVYMARQLFRDSLAAAMTSGANIVPVLGALQQIGKPSSLQSRGITGGQVFTGMPEDVTRMLKDMQAGKIGVTSGLAWLEAKSAQADALTREAQYQSYLKQGLSEMEATFMALESMNFSKRGLSPTMHMVSTLIPFFNAQIQGLDVLYRAFTGKIPLNERLEIRQKLWTRGLLMAGMSMAYAAAMQDEEEYKNAKPEEKYGNWFVNVPGFDQMVRLPIPFELGYVFKALPEAIVNTFSNEKGGEEAMKAAAHIGKQMVPGLSNYFLPQAVKPGLEVLLNKSIYTDRAIESTKEQEQEPGFRYRDSTTALAREVGELTNTSPVKMEYLIRGYTGSMGMALLAALSAPFGSAEGPQAATKRMSDMPVIGTLFQPKDASGIIDATYDRMKEVNQVKETYEGLIEKGRIADAQKYISTRMNEMALASVAGSFREYMGQIAEYERGIKASNMTPDEKREKLDAARQMKIKLAEAVRGVADRKAPQAVPA